MVKMQMACLVIVLYLVIVYIQGKRRHSLHHQLFLVQLVVSIVNLVFDAITVYTVNHLDTVNPIINHLCHQVFIASLAGVLFTTFCYSMLLIEEGDKEKPNIPAYWFLPLIFSIAGVIFGPLKYMETPAGNYSYGFAANMAYFSVAFYSIIAFGRLLVHWKKVNAKKRYVVVMALGSQIVISVCQAFYPLYLISGLGVTLLNLSFFLTLESPDVHLIERLQEEKERANAANAAKSTFLANMSHEIRTPINSIMGMNEMILRESQDEEVRQYATDIETASHTLLGLINDILDLSKIESGKMRIVEAEYDVCSMIQDLWNMISLKAEAKGLEIVCNIDKNIPVSLMGDELRIKQVLTNLLANAVKYTQKGKVGFSVTAKLHKGEAILLFSVEDTGCGIKKEDISKLFDKFERLDENKNHFIEGSGLGMSITMQMLKMMDSNLQVESEYGKGSRFSFSLKQRVINEAPIGDFTGRLQKRAKQISYRSSFCAPDACVLLVDDNDMNRKVFCSLVKQQLLQIDDVGSGRECLKKICEKHYDLIFMDHMMPEMDGIETFENMKKTQDSLCKDTPVVILTANAVVGAKEKYMAQGFTAFLSKPVFPAKLENILYDLLPDGKIMSPEAAIAREEHGGHKLVEQLPPVPGIDWKVTSQYHQEVDILCKLLQGFASESKDYIDELNQCCKNLQDQEVLRKYQIRVHSIKGTAAWIGATDLSTKAKHLEECAQNKEINEIIEKTPDLDKDYETLVKNILKFLENQVA